MENRTKQTRQLFNNKKSARNELAIMILKEIDPSAYEEMLANQESVKKNLQVYRDGVLLGNNYLVLSCFISSHFLSSYLISSHFISLNKVKHT